MSAREILDQRFQLVGKGAVDAKKRIALTKAFQTLRRLFGDDSAKLTFTISINEAGQILLSPETSIPLHEAWLYKNEAAFASVLRGMEQSKRGKVRTIVSFRQFAATEVEPG